MIQKDRYVWCDAIRLLAFFMLLCCHAADPFYASAAYASSSGASTTPELVQWAVRWGSLVRPCVPLFVMLTGVLSLPMKGNMESFYQKHISPK